MTKTPITDELKRILPSEDKWTKGSFTKDVNGFTLDLYNPEGACHCLSGATLIASRNLDISVSKIIDLFEPIVNGRSSEIINFNDSCSTTFQDIQNLLNKAAELEAQGLTNE